MRAACDKQSIQEESMIEKRLHTGLTNVERLLDVRGDGVDGLHAPVRVQQARIARHLNEALNVNA